MPGAAVTAFDDSTVPRRGLLEDPALAHIARMWLALWVAFGTLAAVSGHNGSDFQMFYDDALVWRGATGGDVATRAGLQLNAPILLPVFAAFTYLPFSIAVATWTVLSIAAAGLVARWLAPHLRLPALDVWLLLTGLQAGALELLSGQVTYVVLLPLFTGTWLADRQGRSGRAGALVGVLCALKPFYGVFLIYFVARRAWRSVTASLLAGAVTTAIGVAFVGYGGYLERAARARQLPSIIGDVYNASVFGIGNRLFAVSPGLFTSWTPLTVSATASVALSAVLGLLVVGGGVSALRGRLEDRDFAYAVLHLAALLLSPLGWLYYLPVGAGPLLEVLQRTSRATRASLAILATAPIILLSGAHYGRFATMAIGQWACAVLVVLLVVVSQTGRDGDPQAVRSR